MTINPSIETMANFTEILKNEPKKAYDFIANYGYLLNKSELIDIVKELIYGIHTRLSEFQINHIMFDVGCELDEQYFEECQEEE